MNEYKILVPLADNDGAPVDLAGLLAQVERLCGGYTLGSPCEGVWVDPANGARYVDTLRPLYLATDAHTARRAARLVCAVAAQVCVYLRLPSGAVEFVAAPIIDVVPQ